MLIFLYPKIPNSTLSPSFELSKVNSPFKLVCVWVLLVVLYTYTFSKGFLLVFNTFPLNCCENTW